MHTPTIYDPSRDDSLGALRGGGRVVSVLKENLTDSVRFVSDLSKVAEDDTLLIPLWRVFQPPLLSSRIAQKQILMLFDVIPMKNPDHFPVGLKGRWRMVQNIRALKHFDRIITISEHSKQDIVDYVHIDPEMIDIVYPTTSAHFFKPLPKSKVLSKAALTKKYNLPKKAFAVYVADTNWNKNLSNIALALMKADIPCVFVGRAFDIITELREMDEEARQDYFSRSSFINHPEQREFKEFIKLAIHDEDRFIFTGYIPDADVMQIYRQAACNLLVSRDEGFGLSYLEAATQKCPSVLGDISVFREIAGKTALFADPEMPERIAKHITKLAEDKKFRAKMSQAAFKQSKKYAPDVFAQDMLDILNK